MRELRTHNARPCYAIALGLTTAFCLAACMPRQYEVRAGVDPRYADEDVRFRATYYFRVFDYCDEPDSQSDATSALPTTGQEQEPKQTSGSHRQIRRRIMSDSLYRFRMTGKANAVTNKVHFEAGTLKAWQVDPFGATVTYNYKANRVELQSPDKASQQVGSSGSSRVDGSGPKESDGASNGDKSSSVASDAAPSDEASKSGPSGEPSVNKKDRPRESKTAFNSGKSETTPRPNAKAHKCDDGSAGEGFQIYGPEGWLPFDLDERLLLVMSSSGQPLIQTMSELADRVQGAKSGGDATGSQALLAEQINVLEAKLALKKDTDNKKPIGEALDDVIQVFGK